MKKLNFFKPIIIVILFMSVLTGCDKEENLSTGNVRISFVNHPSDLTVMISPAESINIPIYTKLDSFSGDLETKLNIGNYYLYCQSNSSYPAVYQNLGFQIRAGETTVIGFDGNNVAHIQ